MPFPGSFPQGLSPWYVGQTFPAWATQLLYDDSTPMKLNPVILTGLTGSAIALRIQPVDVNGVAVGNASAGAGVFAITDGPNGKISYTLAAGDVFVAGVGWYQLQFRVTMTGGLWESDYFMLQTKASP
jgi:hypothetical protein